MAIDVDQFHEEFKRLLGSHPGLEFRLTAMQAWCLFATIQLACRHPQFVGPTRQIVEEIARQVQSEIATTPALEALAEKGWDPNYDVEG